MAVMWPRKLPDWINRDDRRSAERRVFDMLSAALDDSWEVFYSRPWWGLSAKGEELDGEADFILAHPIQGLLFLEVKGGRISFDPLTSHWYTTDRFGGKYRIKNPVEQAKSCRYRFLEQLKKEPSWPKGRIRARYGVIFTDSLSIEPRLKLVGGYERHLFCFANDLSFNLGEWIAARLQSNEGSEEDPLGPVGIECVRRRLAEPLQLRVSLQRESEDSLEQMQRILTGAQLQILTSLWSVERGVVCGGAGTGKTVVASEFALRKGRAGGKILLCCVNSALALNLKNLMLNEPNVDVLSITQQSKILSSYDVILIDEAQDVPKGWWIELERSINPSSQLIAFTDSNQSIYRLASDLATELQAREYELRLNLRNTDSIAEVTNQLYEGPLIFSSGILGPSPEVLEFSNFQDAKKRVAELIHRLCVIESTRLGLVTILIENSAMRNEIQSELSSLRIPFTDAARRSELAVVIDSVSNFKGLESPIVILVSDNVVSRSRELSYVGVSRARTHLYAFLINSVGSYLDRSFRS